MINRSNYRMTHWIMQLEPDRQKLWDLLFVTISIRTAVSVAGLTNCDRRRI